MPQELSTKDVKKDVISSTFWQNIEFHGVTVRIMLIEYWAEKKSISIKSELNPSKTYSTSRIADNFNNVNQEKFSENIF